MSDELKKIVTGQKLNAKPESTFNELVKTFVFAILLAMIFRSFVFEPFHIPSGSMRSTLLEGDYLFVSKFSYGYSRYSFPLGLPIFGGRVLDTKPERGDVIVFRHPKNPRIDYIKRLVAFPGEAVRVRDGILYINAKPVPRVRIDDYEGDSPGEDGVYRRVAQYIETLPNGRSYRVLDQTKFGEVDFTGEYTVPEGHYFFMGDNRDNSIDSRYVSQVGFVPEEHLIGRAEIILFSTGDGVQFWEFWKWPEAMRSGRSLTIIQ